MVYNTLTIATAVTPTVIATYISHYLNRKPLHQKPTAHISYHEGVNLVRRFLHYASLHTVEDLQDFTAQWVPHPRWVKVDEATIPDDVIAKAAGLLEAQLGHRGIDKIGGRRWWQWRREGSVLKAEWIEMRKDYIWRKRMNDKGKRVMLYVHGGAYFFGSVDEHRYQMQRHARKLKARVFARMYHIDLSAALFTRYRLAPQFPFPCGLHDCLSAYLYLLTVQDPSTIILAGDSAGGGMVLSILVILRDRGLPLPAGAILISPWVDLTHSFPSVAGDNTFDYIPAHGFMHRPSASWPPPNSDDMEQIAMHAVEAVVGEDLPRKSTQHDRQEATQEATQGFTVEHVSETLQNGDNPADAEVAGLTTGNKIPGPGHELSIVLDGKMVTIKDQIQMYATNQLISHPLVSPALQPSLGGLPPLLIMTGGGEILRDEQIYIAHKAANPAKFPPGDAYLEEYPEAQDVIAKWKPTDVQLQVWEDLCHVAPTLSFTRPAKYMYRSIAQFGAWTLARAQRTEIDIQDDDAVSVISEESANETDSSTDLKKHRTTAHSGLADHQALSTGKVGKAGDTLPPFQNHMIRQRVDRHGHVYPLGPASSLPGLQMSPNEIGVIKPGPVRKWLEARTHWDHKYAREKRKVQRQRIKEMARGFDEIGDDEVPPPSALARRRGKDMPKEGKKTKSMGLSLWSLWGSSHDEKTIVREEKADGQHETAIVPPEHGDSPHSTDKNKVAAPPISRSRSRSRVVTDQGQTNYIRNPIDATHPSTAHPPQPKLHPHESTASNTLAPLSPPHLSPGQIPPSNTSPPRAAATTTAGSQPRTSSRPTADGVAFPFKLSRDLNPNTSSAGASMITLTSHAGVITPKEGDWSGSRKALEGRTGLEGDGDGVGRVGGQEGERVGGEREGKGGSGGGEGSKERPGVERFVTAREGW